MKLSEALEQGYATEENGNIRLVKDLTELVVDIEVSGYLWCSYNNLTLLEINQPIGGSLGCTYNELTTLEINQPIGGSLWCHGNNLTTRPDYTRLQNGDKGDNWIYADGILKLYNKVKRLNDVTFYIGVFGVTVEQGETYAHGKDMRSALNDLRFKLAERDVSQYESLTLDSVITHDEAVIMYRVITGACQMGTEEFIEANREVVKDEYTIGELIELTNGAYGSNTLREYFKVANQ